MENKVIHKWRCMHCGEMADTYICSHCGKESYEKTSKDEDAARRQKNLDNTEQISIVTNKENNQHGFLPEAAIKGLKREISTFAERLNANIIGIGKTTKIVACVFALLFIVQSVMFTMNYSNIKGTVHDLEETNKELSTLVSSQSEKMASLEKAITEIADSQIEYVIHTVTKGETLAKICKKYNIDFKANEKIICSLNGIESPNIIRVGQTLVLPVFK